jgi:Dynein light chain type 1
MVRFTSLLVESITSYLRILDLKSAKTVSFVSIYPRHVIVGRNFGSYVTHETKHFIYFYLGQVAILLFKSG